jgi:hypothetical protein
MEVSMPNGSLCAERNDGVGAVRFCGTLRHTRPALRPNALGHPRPG